MTKRAAADSVNEEGASKPGHPFAPYVQAIGRGPTLSRELTEDEATTAMGMILDGQAEPIQLGAFLMVLRYRKETAIELAGFARAARERFVGRVAAHADLDWPSYADRHKQLPYFVLAALLLAQNGVRVMMHGIAGSGAATTPKVLTALGVPQSATLGEAVRRLDEANFAYVSLSNFCPGLDRLFALRPLFGLRSPANTFSREINPLNAPCQVQGIFHPTYMETHIETARLLGGRDAAVFKGGGGEVQRNPEKPCRVARLTGGVASEETWDALTPEQRYPWRDEPLDPARLLALWRGEWSAPEPEAAVIGTAAIALAVLKRAATPAAADALAAELWRSRSRNAPGR